VLSSVFRIALLAAAATAPLATAALASPWAEVGDQQLRSDIQILANAGIIDDITTHWPIPWAGIEGKLNDADRQDMPDYVRAAMLRVRAKLRAQIPGKFHAGAYIDATNKPDVVYGFDGLGRDKYQGQVYGEAEITPSTDIRIQAGAIDEGGKTKIMADGSYLAQALGNSVIYAGYLTHWWGPGWTSALSLSNNARPMPQIGISRLDTAPFDTPLLSWLGPWQSEVFVGVLDGPRIDRNTGYVGFRFTFNPLPGLQIGLSRTTEICGENHTCDPADYFNLANDTGHRNTTNDEGLIDLHYTNRIGGLPFEVYTQFMNEDSNPFSHSDTSHQVGGSVWVPVSGNPLRLTAEYTDSVPTLNMFGGDLEHGQAYNNSQYLDGMRYRGRTLGFSLDSDSRLFTVQGSWIDHDDFTYTLTLHHADVSTPQNTLGNAVTAAPVAINEVEARAEIPFNHVTFALEARYADDQPRPSRGAEAAFEGQITVHI
jgi:hypothetical protein